MNFALLVLLTTLLFLRPEELVPEIAGLRLYLVTIAVALAVSVPNVVRQFDPGELRWNPITVCVLGFLAAGMAAHAAHGQFGLAAEFATELGKVILFYLLVVGVLDNRSRLDAYLGWLVALIAGVTALALLQHHGSIDIEALRPIEQVDVDRESGELTTFTRLRGSGIFNDPNDLCLILGVGIVCALYQVSRTDRTIRRLFWLAPVAIFLYALALTYSRGGLLGIGAAVTAFVILRYGWRRGAVVLAFLVPLAAVLFAGRQTDLDMSAGTGQDRIHLWAEGLELLFADNVLIGIGPGEYLEQLPQVAHNSFVHSYVETGVVGGSLFLAAFALATAVLAHMAASEVAASRLSMYLFALTVGYAAGMMSLSRAYVVPTFLVLGLATAYLNVAERDPPIWYRVHARLIAVLTGLGIVGLVSAKAFVMLFAQYS